MDFIKLGNHIFNKQYIKYVVCNETDCSLVIRNTENNMININIYSTRYINKNPDIVFKYNKENDPLEYNKLKNLFKYN